MSQSSEHTETQQISLKLEHYDDIFSDFDMRHYGERALSVDFLDEMRRASRDKREDEVELVLNIPQGTRNEAHEPTIMTRLAAHFERHHKLLQDDKHRVLKLGISMIVLGVIAMIVATYIVFNDPTHDAVRSFLVVFLEPAAWFLLWEGMDQIMFNTKNINPELEFYRKMSNTKGRVHFRTY